MRLNPCLIVLTVAIPLRYEGGSVVAPPLPGLQEAYRASMSAQIRQTFDRTVIDPSCAESVLVNLFTKKFIILGIERDDVGSHVATLVFEGESHPFLLWMDDTGDGGYKLRRISELPEPLGEGVLRQLHRPAYHQYWL